MDAIKKTNTRKTNLELLRVISMFMIILHHFTRYSGFSFSVENAFGNRIIVDILSMFGKLGVTLFIMISGYFYDKASFKLNKFLKLLITVWIYSMIGLTIGILTKSNQLGLINFAKSLFPVTLGQYWFITCYILIYLFSPYVKTIIDKMERKDLKHMLIIAFIIWSVIAVVPKAKTFTNEFIILELIYFIGAYIRKYDVNILNNKKRILCITGIILCMVIIMVILEILSNYIYILKNNDGYIRRFNDLSSPFIIVLTILIFNIFKNINIRCSNVINLLASTTLGIYLIHENIFLRKVIWQKLFVVIPKTNVLSLCLAGLLETVVVFAICACIDIIIQNTIIKLMNKLIIYIHKNSRLGKGEI